MNLVRSWLVIDYFRNNRWQIKSNTIRSRIQCDSVVLHRSKLFQACTLSREFSGSDLGPTLQGVPTLPLRRSCCPLSKRGSPHPFHVFWLTSVLLVICRVKLLIRALCCRSKWLLKRCNISWNRSLFWRQPLNTWNHTLFIQCWTVDRYVIKENQMSHSRFTALLS